MAATALLEEAAPNVIAASIEERIEPQEGPQTDFLECNADIVFYGGSAGGGKSYGLLLECLYDIDNPLFGAVFFRRTTKQITAEGGLWDEATDLYAALGAKANLNDGFYKFPSGAKVSFHHMEHEKNRLDWQGSQIPLICFDELTHFTWRQFYYLMSRNRSKSGAKSRIRATLNPDPDHWARRFIDWWIGEDGFAIPERSGIIRWFITINDEIIWSETRQGLIDQYSTDEDEVEPNSFTFIRSSVYDNRILLKNDPSYLAKLKALPKVEREQLLDGNWNVRASAGMYFQRTDFKIVDAAPVAVHTVRAWDQAGTEEKQDDPTDPDHTAGVKVSQGMDGYFYVEHVERFREDPSEVDRRIENTASQDGKLTSIRLAQDPGSAGKALAQAQVRKLAGYYVTAIPATGSKETRARPASAQVRAGNVRLVKGDWNEAFLNELEAFPLGGHDDQVDGFSDAMDELTGRGEAVYGVPIEDLFMDPFRIPDHWPRMFALETDWGRTSALWGAWDKATDHLYIYTEDAREHADQTSVAAGILARGRWIPGAMNPRSRGRTKEDGDRLLHGWRTLGLNVMPTDNSPEAGIAEVKQRLTTGRIKVFRTCERFAGEYRLYRRDEHGKIVQKFDLLMDDLRLIVSLYRGVAKPVPAEPVSMSASAGDTTVGY